MKLRDKMAGLLASKEKSFGDYKAENHFWVTLASGEYYPDVLPQACELYRPVLVLFGQILEKSHSSTDFFMNIAAVDEAWMRVQLARVFRKYVSPETPVEMLKRRSAAKEICERFGKGFRVITEVQKRFKKRPMPDEALCAILWEYKDRGKKGYDLTERLFEILRKQFPKYEVTGPERAGKDILMGNVFPNYPRADRSIDFMIKKGKEVLAVGLARYDSDRGGAQEDDRTGQYRDCAQEVIGFASANELKTKVIFLNDGPGLLLGSMWKDYAGIESMWGGRVRVVTLRMVPERITKQWLES